MRTPASTGCWRRRTAGRREARASIPPLGGLPKPLDESKGRYTSIRAPFRFVDVSSEERPDGFREMHANMSSARTPKRWRCNRDWLAANGLPDRFLWKDKAVVARAVRRLRPITSLSNLTNSREYPCLRRCRQTEAPVAGNRSFWWSQDPALIEFQPGSTRGIISCCRWIGGVSHAIHTRKIFTDDFHQVEKTGQIDRSRLLSDVNLVLLYLDKNDGSESTLFENRVEALVVPRVAEICGDAAGHWKPQRTSRQWQIREGRRAIPAESARRGCGGDHQS